VRSRWPRASWPCAPRRRARTPRQEAAPGPTPSTPRPSVKAIVDGRWRQPKLLLATCHREQLPSSISGAPQLGMHRWNADAQPGDLHVWVRIMPSWVHHARSNPAGRRRPHYGYRSWLAAATGMSSDDVWHRLGGPDAAPIGHRWTRGPILRAWTGAGPDSRSGRRRGDLTPTSPTCVQRARTGTNRAESLEQPLTTFRALWTPCSRFAPDKIPTP
jgi:hypothetical protein